MRSGLDRLAAMAALLGWRGHHHHRGLAVLMYHRVLPAAEARFYPLASLALPVEAFEEQTAWLAANCDVRPLGEAAAGLEPSDGGQRPLISLTFDDGYADNAEIVTPILERHGLRATFFVTTGFVQKAKPMWFDIAAEAWMRGTADAREAMMFSLPKRSNGPSGRLTDIRAWMQGLKSARPAERMACIERASQMASGEMESTRYRPMFCKQLADLRVRGHEVGSHTVTHPILPQLDDDELHRELVESKAMLEEWIGGEVRGFCYPNGDFDERVKKAVIDAGYRYACTTRPGMNRRNADPVLLKRIDITPHRVLKRDGTHDLLGFRAEVCGWRHLCRRLTFR